MTATIGWLSVLLAFALVTADFSLQYVATNSSLRIPLYYRVTGLWGALEGSLLAEARARLAGQTAPVQRTTR